MAEQPAPTTLTSVERDPRLFTWFLTLVVFVIYIWALTANPFLRQPLTFIPFTLLVAVHVLLHWQIEKIIVNPRVFPAYTLIQGGLAFAICWLAGLEAMVFTLFMALIGESVGMFGLTRRAILASAFFLTLTMFSLNQITNLVAAGWSLLGIIPILVLTLIYTILYKRQAEAREQAQILAAELESANRQLTEYAARVEDLTIAAERERMARELHDTLSQGLAGLTLQLEAADAHLAQNRPEKARQIIAQSMQKAREALADARNAISNLRENHLGELADSLRREVDRFQAATGLPCLFHADSTPHLPDTVKETILRTVSESLTNIARHAQASEAAVTLFVNQALSGAALGAVEAPVLTVTIQDNGIGFDPNKIPSGHYGLLGIRERIRLIGGQLTLASAPGMGTTLTIHVPITQSPNHSISQ